VVQRHILYTEYFNHVITIHLKGGEVYRLRANHSDLENLLIPCGYICSPSKGILINFHEVSQIQDSSVTMSDGAVLPISRRKSKDVRAAFTKFRFRKMRTEVDV
jgi:DNA-binding LytR/AlgR family response regulator